MEEILSFSVFEFSGIRSDTQYYKSGLKYHCFGFYLNRSMQCILCIYLFLYIPTPCVLIFKDFVIIIVIYLFTSIIYKFWIEIIGLWKVLQKNITRKSDQQYQIKLQRRKTNKFQDTEKFSVFLKIPFSDFLNPPLSVARLCRSLWAWTS